MNVATSFLSKVWTGVEDVTEVFAVVCCYCLWLTAKKNLQHNNHLHLALVVWRIPAFMLWGNCTSATYPSRVAISGQLLMNSRDIWIEQVFAVVSLHKNMQQLKCSNSARFRAFRWQKKKIKKSTADPLPNCYDRSSKTRASDKPYKTLYRVVNVYFLEQVVLLQARLELAGPV